MRSVLLTLALSVSCGEVLAQSNSLTPSKSTAAPLVGNASIQSNAAETRPLAHWVKVGDTVYSIAFRYRLNFRDLAAWNALDASYKIKIGQRIRLSPPTNSTADSNKSSTSPQSNLGSKPSPSIATKGGVLRSEADLNAAIRARDGQSGRTTGNASKADQATAADAIAGEKVYVDTLANLPRAVKDSTTTSPSISAPARTKASTAANAVEVKPTAVDAAARARDAAVLATTPLVETVPLAVDAEPAKIEAGRIESIAPAPKVDLSAKNEGSITEPSSRVATSRTAKTVDTAVVLNASDGVSNSPSAPPKITTTKPATTNPAVSVASLTKSPEVKSTAGNPTIEKPLVATSNIQQQSGAVTPESSTATNGTKTQGPSAALTSTKSPVEPSSKSGSVATVDVDKGQAEKPLAFAKVVSSPGNQLHNILWQWPLTGRVVRVFVAGNPVQQGIDIQGRDGEIVRATANGEVVYSGNGLVGYGELVIIKHNNEFLSAYGHNRKRLVVEGEKVVAGQAIAEVGGRDGVLHFEIRKQGKPVDPRPFLPNK